MSGNLKITGINETIAKLQNISKTVDRNVNRIIRESAEPYMEALEKSLLMTPAKNEDIRNMLRNISLNRM